MDRVCYFSNTDLSIGPNLKLAEMRVYEYEKCVPSELNGIIELWHIRKLYENVSVRPEYSEEFEKIKSKTSEYNSIVARYFKKMSPTDAVEEYKTLKWAYRNTFWTIIDQFKCYNAIDADALKSIVGANINELRCILKNCRLVERYKQAIKELLLNEKLSAHLLLDEYVACPINNDNEHLYFPSCLSIREREDIVIKYLESEDPNLNYVRLITQTKDVVDKFVLSPKTRLKAERLARKLNDDLLHDPRTCITKRQFEVVFSCIEDKRMMSVSYEKGYPSYNYRKQFIYSCSAKDKVIYCGRVFNWMDKFFLVNLINKNCEVSAIESALMDKSKTAYPNYQKFEDKNNLAQYQLAGYNSTLLQLGMPIERLLENFYTNVLNDEFGYAGLPIKLPKEEEGWLEKCRIIYPELDNIARQYNTFVDDGEIDPELLKMLPPQKMSEAKSLLKNKYYEVNEKNPIIKRVLFHLFASGSLLYHVEPYKDKGYHSLTELMAHETVYYDLYENYQKCEIDFLIENRILKIDKNRKLRYENIKVLSALETIWEFGCCSYWHYDKDVRKGLDDLLELGFLVTDDHLLTKNERGYFSYYTDDSKYTNGYAYRNHYAHGSSPQVDDDNAHVTAYFTMLRLFIILILKICDDLWLARLILAENPILPIR